MSDKPYHALGFGCSRRGPTCHFRSSATGQVLELKPGRRFWLQFLSLAPLEYWLSCYPGQDGRPDWLRVYDALLREAERAGRYDPKEPLR